MIKLREILKMPVFEGFKIVAGASGIDRDISTVSVMDAPDIYRWMKGGEFLITSAYVVKDNPDYIKSLIENLDKWGASALGVKFDRFIHELPEDALASAERLGFPIVSIPIEFAFTDIINPILREVIDSQSKKMLYTENVHNAFTRMVLEDEKIPSILSFLEQHIRRDVYLLDTCFLRTYYSETSEPENGLLKALSAQEPEFAQLSELLDSYEHYRLYINEDEYGYLFLGERWDSFDKSFQDYYKIAIEQAVTVLILKIQKELAAAQIEANYREQFVQDLLRANFKSKEEIENRAQIYNWNFYSGGIVVIVDIDHFKQQYLEQLDRERNEKLEKTMNRILNISRQILNREYKEFVYSRLSDQIVFIISDAWKDKEKAENKLRRVFETVKREIRNTVFFTATIGIGTYRTEIEKICISWEEAKKAVRISRNMMREDCISEYEELGAYKLLSLVSTSSEAEEFEQKYIKKLKEYDCHYHTELLETVCRLTADGWNLKEASKSLYIHYNSMKYRYQKICKVLEVDLSQQEQRLNLELAVKLHQMREPV